MSDIACCPVCCPSHPPLLPLLQKLKGGLADALCLDGTRITGRGIVSGSNFAPPPLDKTDFCFGATPHGQVGVWLLLQTMGSFASEVLPCSHWAHCTAATLGRH